MKTKGRKHQLEAVAAADGREYFAYLAEQGTGKTWMVLADAEREYGRGTINGLVVVAPKGVHTNWTLREIPKHLSAPHIAASYSSGMSKRDEKKLNKLFDPVDDDEIQPLRILTINIDALITKKGYTTVLRFLRALRGGMLVIDESTRIKNERAGRTKRVMQLKDHARFRRIANGTPITNAPLDAFAQFEFLENGLLGTNSYRTFVATYAELLPQNSKLVEHIKERSRFPNAQPQVIKTNSDGTKRWRNLDRLSELIKAHSYRVLKRDCSDLPEKIYKTYSFVLPAAQRQQYESLQELKRLEINEELLTVNSLSALNKLQQVTSGFVLLNGEVAHLDEKSERLKLFDEIAEDLDGKFIVWAHFTEELKQIAALLRAKGVEVVEYHGAIGDKERERAVDAFQEGSARAFVGQPQAGGVGLTLTAAETVIYYSNDFNAYTRLQSEDRAHRDGLKHPVVYIDIVAEDTIDETIARALQRKSQLAARILD